MMDFRKIWTNYEIMYIGQQGVRIDKMLFNEYIKDKSNGNEAKAMICE